MEYIKINSEINYLENKVYLKILDIKSEHFDIALATNNTKESLCQLDQKTITKKMSIYITHFKLKVMELEEEIVMHENELRNYCDGERLTFCKTYLTNLKINFTKTLKRKSTKS